MELVISTHAIDQVIERFGISKYKRPRAEKWIRESLAEAKQVTRPLTWAHMNHMIKSGKEQGYYWNKDRNCIIVVEGNTVVTVYKADDCAWLYMKGCIK